MKTIPSGASERVRVASIALVPAFDKIIVPSSPSIRILLRLPRASSSTALSETDKIAADIADTIPSFTSLARTEQIGNPWTETIALPCISALTASIFRNNSISSLMFSLNVFTQKIFT